MNNLKLKNTKELKTFIKTSLPTRLEKYMKKIKGIHNLLNKLIIIGDPNCDHLNHDIPLADQAAWDFNDFISDEFLKYEITQVRFEKDFSLKMSLIVSYMENNKEEDGYFEEYLIVNVLLKNDRFTISAIRN